jgi:hypothetical protein
VGSHTLHSRRTGAMEAHPITGTGTSSLARLGLTGISSQALAATGAAPPRLTHTAEPGRGFSQGWQVAREASRG